MVYLLPEVGMCSQNDRLNEIRLSIDFFSHLDYFCFHIIVCKIKFHLISEHDEFHELHVLVSSCP